MLGGAARIGESILLQTLTKKVVGTVAKEKDIPTSASIATPDGDTDLSKFEEGTSLLDASAAGAFVHGLEDEFSEVSVNIRLQIAPFTSPNAASILKRLETSFCCHPK